MNILIVEDEPLVARKLHKLVLELEPDATVTAITDSVSATAQWLTSNAQPDLILMDIELADGQSFEIFKKVQVTSPVIFTTAYNEYAIRAFKVNSVDYLLKPVKKEELQAALNKFHKLVTRPEVQTGAIALDRLCDAIKSLPVSRSYKDRFLVKQGQKSFSITTQEIALFYTEKSISYAFTNDRRKFIVDYTLDEIEDSVDPGKFFRTNRQSIVASTSVVAVHPWFNGKLKLDIKPEHQEHVVISREKAGEFRHWLGE